MNGRLRNANILIVMVRDSRREEIVSLNQLEMKKRKTLRSSETELQIFQIFYQPLQQKELDPDFIPYPNLKNPRPDLCEYHIFRNEFFKGNCNSGLTGFVSWKFFEKTGLTGKEFQEWIATNPGYDVYFINPYPMQKRTLNVWRQGNRRHPNISKIAQSLFSQCGRDVDLLSLSMAEEHVAFCNYWVGAPSFWKKYIDFCEPICEIVEDEISKDGLSCLLEQADKKSGLCYIPYILERLFSTMLTLDSSVRSLSVARGHSVKLTWADWFQRELKRTYQRCAS